MEHPRLLYSLGAILCFADNLNGIETDRCLVLGLAGNAPVHCREQGFETAPGPRLVIGDEYSRIQNSISSGTVRVTVPLKG